MLWPVLGPSSFWNIPPCRCRVEHVDVVPGPGPARGSSTTVQIRWDVWSPRRAPRSPFHQFQTFHQKMWENKLRSVLIATDVAARGLDIKGQPPTTLQVFEWIDIGLGHTGSYWVILGHNFVRSMRLDETLQGVTMVVNYDSANSAEDHVHRRLGLQKKAMWRLVIFFIHKMDGWIMLNQSNPLVPHFF